MAKPEASTNGEAAAVILAAGIGSLTLGVVTAVTEVAGSLSLRRRYLHHLRIRDDIVDALRRLDDDPPPRPGGLAMRLKRRWRGDEEGSSGTPLL